MHPRALRVPVAALTLPPALAGGHAGTGPSATPRMSAARRGALNGVYYPTGAICRLLNDDSSSNHGLHCTVQSTSGSIANLAALARVTSSSWRWCSRMFLYHAAHGSALAGQTRTISFAACSRLPQGVPDPARQRAPATSARLADTRRQAGRSGRPSSRGQGSPAGHSLGCQRAGRRVSLPCLLSPGKQLPGDSATAPWMPPLLVAGHPKPVG